MIKALGAILKWIALCFVPYYIVLCLVICIFMWLTCGIDSIRELWPVVAILGVPLAGMVAASQSIPPPHSGY